MVVQLSLWCNSPEVVGVPSLSQHLPVPTRKQDVDQSKVKHKQCIREAGWLGDIDPFVQGAEIPEAKVSPEWRMRLYPPCRQT